MRNIGKNLTKKLNHQIKFLENQNNNEIEANNWLETITTFAEITAVNDYSFKAIEHFNFGHVMTENYYIFRIRFDKRISNKMRISFNNRLFEIKRLINIKEKDQLLQIITLEI